MAVEVVKEKWVNKVSEVSIGGKKPVKSGGQGCPAFLFLDGAMPNRPLIAMEVWDMEPREWPEDLKKVFGSALKDPAEWAKKCVDDFGADLISLTLEGTNPQTKNASPDQAAETVKRVLKAVNAPLVITGSGDKEKDNEVLLKCSHAARGQKCLLGMASQDNYKTLTAACMADGHSIIAESPIDINIAKQVNILITDMGFPTERIVMHPTSSSLGYGMEYTYSIMERGRLAALTGDKMLAMPFIVFPGAEAWKVKEAGVLWEATTAACLLQAGADILVMRHPDAVRDVSGLIVKLMKK